jgi:hypothetical protein
MPKCLLCDSLNSSFDEELLKSCWNNPAARLAIPETVKMFGPPNYDVRLSGGEAVWINVGVFDALFIEDILSNHNLCRHHCDSMLGEFTVLIRPEWLNMFFLIDPSFGYQTLRYVMVIQCHTVKWVTAISYVFLRFLDSLEFPEYTNPFSVNEARKLLKEIVCKINEEPELYIEIQQKIKKYLKRNHTKYHDIIFKKCKPCIN